MVERAAQLDPTLEHYFVLALLGSYHARSAMAEPEEARKLFETALAQTQGKNLLIPLQYATTYACAKGDAALYQNLLHRVVDAQNPDPEESLPNTVAKHFARRWLGKKWAKDQCGIELAGK
jgi:hypothetical protein